MCIEPKMDAGPILASRSTPIGPNETAGGLESRLAVIGADLLVSAIAGWLEGSLSGQPQDEAAATYCRVLAKEDGLLTSAMTAAEAERAVRAFDPWPGAYVNYRGERLAIWRGQVLAVQAPAGNLTIRNGLPAIGFGEQSLCLLEVQRAGGRRLAGSDFVNGQRGRLEPVVGLG
jgi:methionyl-tRNA formyltransferase